MESIKGVVPQATAAAAVAQPEGSSPVWPGAKIAPLLASVSLGLVLNYLVPTPEGITQQGWALLSIFVSTIAGLVLEPLPVGAWAFLSATVAIATKTLSFTSTFTAFTNDVIWLIVVSFFFAKVRCDDSCHGWRQRMAEFCMRLHCIGI